MTTTWPDAILSVRFLTPEEGGRTVAVQGGAFYACPMFVGEDAFDCRLHLDGRRLELGTAYLVSVRFLNRQPRLQGSSWGKPSPCGKVAPSPPPW